MTVALAALSGLLLVVLVVTAVSLRLQKLHHAENLVATEKSLTAMGVELESLRDAAAEAQDRLNSWRSASETSERLRLEREWAELAGPSVPLPAPWDGTLGAALATELEIIRETVGTPSTLEVVGAGTARETAGRFPLALSAEFLRAAARASDEMRVRLDGNVVVSGTSDACPDLSQLQETVRRAGARLQVDSTDGGFTATLRFDGDDA
jgi:hypothetical protein